MTKDELSRRKNIIHQMRDTMAFPVPERAKPGMMLRDWFAGQVAEQCLCEIGPDAPAQVAAKAYQIADALMRVRAGIAVAEDKELVDLVVELRK